MNIIEIPENHLLSLHNTIKDKQLDETIVNVIEAINNHSFDIEEIKAKIETMITLQKEIIDKINKQ